MSESTSPPANTPPPAPNDKPVLDSLASPQFLISLLLAGAVVFVMVKIMLVGSDAMQDKVLTLATLLASGVMGFWLGSSVSSQRKDAASTTATGPAT